MDPRFRKRVLVIGGGLGGLAAAVRCAHAGCEVTVIDRQEEPGGKMCEYQWQGYRWDMGPSLLTMPHVLRELWEQCGARLENDVELIPLDNTCRYHWSDGTVVEENADFWARPEVAAFLRHSHALYDLGANVFLHHPLSEWSRHLKLSTLGKLGHLPKMLDPRSLAATTERFFPDSPHLRQLFNRFATYNGSSPWLTPSAFHIIAGVQQRFGGWYARGGMVAIARALTTLARRKGVRFETGMEALRIQRNGPGWTVFIRPPEGGAVRPLNGDGIICNQDALAATQRFLDPGFTPKRTLSSSGFVIAAALDTTFPDLDHHNIFFSDDYPAEFRAIFEEGESPRDPTIYICNSSHTDPGRAPAGGSNWFVLVNTPALKPGADWERFASSYADTILSKLTRFGLPDPRPHILHRKLFTPADFAIRDLSHGGALYGYASHGSLASFLRPSMVSPQHGFVFAGGSTHPGGGVPLVLLSGQMAARLLMHQLEGPEIPLRDALMPG